MGYAPLIIDIEGLELSKHERELILHPFVGGIILFRRNYSDKLQLIALIKSIRQLKFHIFISVDHEGGRVQRFVDGFTHIPPMEELGLLYESEPSMAVISAKKYGEIIANELKTIGIDASYTPVLDLGGKNTSVIGDRAFHVDPDIVAELASSLIDGLHAGGLPAIGKHFPGHGFVKEDSHHVLPYDSRSYDEIAAKDLIPFQALNQKLDGIMLAHIIFDSVCSLPVTFSSKWIKETLRCKIGFRGQIYSDDLSMQAMQLYGTMPERVQKALNAGCDRVLVCNDQKGVAATLDAVSRVA